ncbi:creatininase family protein [Bacillus sp. FJAT-45350]|uniref:creatininase family protein n=1 Tax=Bacillus sp. FJAT-45350 TaxID=2011014 RepID=UPI000BB7FDFE|nr:creatininase family protein [Bacillus sp. FJAT-45350]
MNAYLLTDMTWEEVERALETVEIAIIPIGAQEQHGPHMAESCDSVLATEMSNRLAERLFPHALVTPTINMGISPHHLNFPGTITLKPSTLQAILRDMIESLKHHGIKRFLLLNAHGGNQSTLSVASTTLSQELDVQVYFAKTTASAKEAMTRNIDSPLFGHSCEREVSEALYLAPHIVRRNLLTKGDIQEEGRWKMLRPGKPLQGFYAYEEMTRNGCIGDATKASEEIGKEIVEEALTRLSESVRLIIEQENTINNFQNT